VSSTTADKYISRILLCCIFSLESNTICNYQYVPLYGIEITLYRHIKNLTTLFNQTFHYTRHYYAEVHNEFAVPIFVT